MGRVETRVGHALGACALVDLAHISESDSTRWLVGETGDVVQWHWAGLGQIGDDLALDTSVTGEELIDGLVDDHCC